MAKKKSKRLSVSSRRRQKQRADTDDVISDLPDSIICHILSVLPTRNAVATGILSKRWKLLWTTAINLDFCFPKDDAGSVEQFVQFVNYVLILHKPGRLNRFALRWEARCIPFYVNTWICGAVAREVRELLVTVEIFNLPIHVQSFIFTSEWLQSLELDCSICISSEIVVSLPILERLKLISVYFQSDKAFRKLLDGCPVLKYLVIEMDVRKMIDNGYINIVDGIAFNVDDDGSAFKCIISSAFLAHLDLCVYDNYSAPPSQGPTPQGLCCVELDAPSLQYIVLQDMIHSIFIQQKSLAFLGEADIQVCGLDSEEPNYCNSFIDAVSAFGCAKTLYITDQVIRITSCATVKMSARLNRLTRLDVVIDWNHWSSLQDFIELSDNLEVLIIYKNKGYFANGTHFNNSNWKNPDLIPECLSNSLRTVSIGAYDGYPDEIAMVEYIIKHGSVLKIMQICFGESINNDFKRKYELIQQICAVTRKSTICEVKFHDYGSELDAL